MNKSACHGLPSSSLWYVLCTNIYILLLVCSPSPIRADYETSYARQLLGLEDAENQAALKREIRYPSVGFYI
ncbi:hypothetical protein DEU56DRAFT_786956 [Suillus clintonianus]|uniref:uncharacterized protein n=1 Tax=Suillus clintonianus TaxID=1904413 RepID=UPI001B882006|nr:uncharacterized protein DEU56DRAFT_786956 [Suillus clintonianus]KAG2146238.1 hypothetical protein DEU56DRAFT_786956 [Suillus clintonianus]